MQRDCAIYTGSQQPDPPISAARRFAHVEPPWPGFASQIVAERHAALTPSSLSAPRMTILSASSGNGRCSAFGLVPWRSHPNVALFVGEQDHRHRLGMDRLDQRVGRCREKPVDLMRPRHRLRLRAAITAERRPYAREGEQQTLLIQYEPDHILLRCAAVQVFWRLTYAWAISRSDRGLGCLSALT